jgi:hypothetical protein
MSSLNVAVVAPSSGLRGCLYMISLNPVSGIYMVTRTREAIIGDRLDREQGYKNGDPVHRTLTQDKDCIKTGGEFVYFVRLLHWDHHNGSSQLLTGMHAESPASVSSGKTTQVGKQHSRGKHGNYGDAGRG